MQKNTFLFLLIVCCTMAVAQKDQILTGKIVSTITDIGAVHIINVTQETGAINDAAGNFSIMAKSGDQILFSSVQFEKKKYLVIDENLNSDNLVVRLIAVVNELEEVTIQKHSLTGDVQKDLEKIPTYEKNFPMWKTQKNKETGVVYADDAQSEVQNSVMNLGPEGAAFMDLDLVIDLISRIFKSKEKSFIEENATITSFYSEDFLVQELGISKTQYYDFLDFINEQPRSNRSIEFERQPACFRILAR